MPILFNSERYQKISSVCIQSTIIPQLKSPERYYQVELSSKRLLLNTKQVDNIYKNPSTNTNVVDIKQDLSVLESIAICTQYIANITQQEKAFFPPPPPRISVLFCTQFLNIVSILFSVSSANPEPELIPLFKI